MTETTLVLRDSSGVTHMPGENLGTQRTKCGLDAGLMVRRQHPLDWDAMWCTECMQVAAGMKQPSAEPRCVF